ncbi:hypothetical protein ACROYT_G018339 [Oculina patagonica]
MPSAFMSTYNKEYTGTFGPPAPDARVRTSRFYPPGQAAVDSTYRTHFLSHQGQHRIKVPFGTSSGNRSNNPHPHNMEQVFSHPNKGYFVWSHYQKLPPLSRSVHAPGGSSSSELLKQVCQDKTRSIYQQDFIPPPQDVSTSIDGSGDWKLDLQR